MSVDLEHENRRLDTTFHVIEGERDFYEKYMNHLREQTKPEVFIYNVPDEDKIKYEDAIQELLTAEVINLTHEKLRARGVSDQLLLSARRDLRSALRELPMPEQDHRLLDSPSGSACR